MTYEMLVSHLDVWVSQYIAGFCLVSILLWAAGSYLWAKQWEQLVRDCGVYLLVIGLLTMVLAVRPKQMGLFEWPPLTWFSFTMLMIMELLWLSFLLLAAVRGVQDGPRRHGDLEKPLGGYRSPYSHSGIYPEQ